jgi:hypothetical protein
MIAAGVVCLTVVPKQYHSRRRILPIVLRLKGHPVEIVRDR